MNDEFHLKLENTFSKLETHNSKEIYEFLVKNQFLLDYYNELMELMKKYFPKSSYSLEFHCDSEFDNLNQLVMYVHLKDEDFEDEWDKLKELNDEIRMTLGNDVKELISVDLW